MNETGPSLIPIWSRSSFRAALRMLRIARLPSWQAIEHLLRSVDLGQRHLERPGCVHTAASSNVTRQSSSVAETGMNRSVIFTCSLAP